MRLLYIALFIVCATACSDNKFHTKTNTDTSWWIGVINKGSMMPFSGSDEFDMNLYSHPDGNHA